MPKTNPRRSGSAGSVRKRLRHQLSMTQTTCAICGRPIDWSEPWNDGHNPLYVELDEIIPVSRWSSEQQVAAATNIENIQAVHRLCNQRKGNKMNFTVDDTQNNSKRRSSRVRASQQW